MATDQSDRKAAHDALQERLQEVQGQYQTAAAMNPSKGLRAHAGLMSSFLSSKSRQAAAEYRNGGSPSLDTHMGLLASCQQHLDKMGQSASATNIQQSGASA